MTSGSTHTAAVFDSPWRGLYGTRIESDRHFGKHFHCTFGLGLIERGAHRSVSGRGQVEAAAGDVIACNPGEVHDGHPVGGRPRRWRMIYIDPDVFASLAGTDLDASAVELTQPVSSDPRTATAVRRLFDALDEWHVCTDDRTIGTELLACEESFVCASALLLGHDLKPVKPGAVPIELQRTRDRIAADLLAPPSLTELAVAAGMSKYQLLRRFEASYGLPPHRWLVQRRVETARALIGRGMSLVEAAASSGFADQSHLTRHFTRQLGFTPGAWRRAVLK